MWDNFRSVGWTRPVVAKLSVVIVWFGMDTKGAKIESCGIFEEILTQAMKL